MIRVSNPALIVNGPEPREARPTARRDLLREHVEQDETARQHGKQGNQQRAGRREKSLCLPNWTAARPAARSGTRAEPVRIVLLQPTVGQHTVQSHRHSERQREYDAGAQRHRLGDQRVIDH